MQVASNPRIVDHSYGARPGKLDVLYPLVEEIIDGEKAIIWTSFTENADWLRRELDSFGSARVHGKMSYEGRNSALHDFKTDDDSSIDFTEFQVQLKKA